MTETSKSADSAEDKTKFTLDDELPTGPGAAFTFMYYFSTAAFITALVTAKTLGVGLATGLPGEVAILGGAIGGSLGVLFNRSRTLEIPFTSKKKFRQEMARVLSSMGYSLDHSEGPIAHYQKPNASRFFAGDIYVQERPKSMVFVSRARNIRTLEKRFNP